MRRIVVAGAMTASGLVLLLSYPTSTGQGLAGAAPTGTSSAGGGSASASGGGAGGAAPSQGRSSAGASKAPSGTYTGAAVGTQWGNVQVEITVRDGHVVDATAVQVPHENSMDAQINSYAVPMLQQETVQAGSARIDAVTGATVTSTGYIQSLQSALDEAGLR
ncbi:FMN-binding protein [Georgenia soli]|uniref:FMN-binding protein n=1 Tax=Georgenia soli TaxID=638953 RepID=A0A2A9EHP5_9MICO|nr:FMN-binding protein [Georgenia soli]PFG38597.1 FMN-binding protein [Georgenia soli]